MARALDKPKLKPAEWRALQKLVSQPDPSADFRVLTSFRRGTQATPEQLRITLGPFEGRAVVSVRMWKRERFIWQPSKPGVRLEVHELDAAIAALEEARAQTVQK